MSNNDLFNDANQTQVPQIDPNKNYLEELVGEGKKFKSIEDLAVGKVHSDAFIQKLQGELEGLRQELNQRARLGDLVDKLAGGVKPQEPTPQSQPNHGGDDGKDTLDPAKIEDLIASVLEKRTQQSARDRNLNDVKSKLSETWGAGFSNKLAEKANELGLSKEDLNELAGRSPQAFYTLVGVGAPQAQPNNGFVPPVSSQRPAQPNVSGDRTKAFYDRLKQTNPVQYWDKSTQAAMHKDALRLGAAFFDN